MQSSRKRRIALGTTCLIVAALVMGWFVGRYIPGQPHEAEPPIAEGLSLGNETAISEVKNFESDSTMDLHAVQQGLLYTQRSDDAPLSEAAIEGLKKYNMWDSARPAIDISVAEVRTMNTASLTDIYPEYRNLHEAPYADSKLIAVTLSITNASENPLTSQNSLPTFTLWNDNIAPIENTLGSGACLDNAFWMLNTPLRGYEADPDNPDKGQFVNLQPGETQTLVLPFKINKNNLKDQSTFGDLDPSDFCIQTADYNTGTVYRLWL